MESVEYRPPRDVRPLRGPVEAAGWRPMPGGGPADVAGARGACLASCLTIQSWQARRRYGRSDEGSRREGERRADPVRRIPQSVKSVAILPDGLVLLAGREALTASRELSIEVRPWSIPPLI